MYDVFTTEIIQVRDKTEINTEIKPRWTPRSEHAHVCRHTPIPPIRSYENLYEFLHEVPSTHQQLPRVTYLVEKHGKGPDDAEIFCPVRRWLNEYLLRPDAFVDSEDALAEVLRAGAAQEMRANPGWGAVCHPGVQPRPTASILQGLDAAA